MFRLPLSVDLCLHAVPALSSLASFILFERKYSKNEVLYGAPLMTVLVTTWYGCWVEYCGRLNGVCEWPDIQGPHISDPGPCSPVPIPHK
jgi:hypothetical protein